MLQALARDSRCDPAASPRWWRRRPTSRPAARGRSRASSICPIDHRAMVHARHRRGPSGACRHGPCLAPAPGRLSSRARRGVLFGAGVDAAFHPAMAPPPMPPIAMPMSVIVASGRLRSGGTGAVMPARGASVARAMPERSTLSADQRVGAVVGRGDDGVIGLGDPDLELVHLHRAHVLPVRLHDRQRQAGNADVEGGHRRGVDDAQPHPLAGREQRRPVVARAVAVDEIGVGLARPVGDVGRLHPHPPHDRRLASVLSSPGDEADKRLLLASCSSPTSASCAGRSRRAIPGCGPTARSHARGPRRSGRSRRDR